MDQSDRQAAEAALALLLEDPSPKVRLALAEGLGHCRATRRAASLLRGLPNGLRIEVAGRRHRAFAGYLADNDLIEIARPGVRVRPCSNFVRLPASRLFGPGSPPLSAEVGEAQAVADMLRSTGPTSRSRASQTEHGLTKRDFRETTIRNPRPPVRAVGSALRCPPGARRAAVRQLAGSDFVRSAIGGSPRPQGHEGGLHERHAENAEDRLCRRDPGAGRASADVRPADACLPDPRAVVRAMSISFASAVVSLSGMSDSPRPRHSGRRSGNRHARALPRHRPGRRPCACASCRRP